MRKSVDWKLGVFGIIALILALGLVVSDAMATTGRITSGGRVIAGSTANAIRIEITGAEAGTAFSVKPPDGFSEMTDTTGSMGFTSVSGGTATAHSATDGVTINPSATTVIISYTNVTAPGNVGRPVFTITEGTATSTFPIVVTADGSGTVEVNNRGALTGNDSEIAGVTGRTFKFLYTAIGTQAQNPNSLDGGELQLEIPRGWPTPTSANIAVNGNPSGDGAPDTASLGNFRITGSGPWFITVPIIAMGGTEEIQIEYKGVTVPFATGTYHFPVSVKEFGGSLTQVASIPIQVTVAGRGSGTMTVSGGPVAASSSGNTLTFVYTAAGTLDGGALELVPPAGWTAPQGGQGSPGYTTITFSTGASGTVNFGEDKGVKRPDFSGNGVGILFTRMRVNDTVTIVYGAGGAGNGVTAPSVTGLSYFDVYVGPSYSHADNAGIGSAEGQGNDAKIANPPFVSVQSQAGTGIVTITDSSGDRATNAGHAETLTFRFEANGDLNGGAFSVTIDNSWPLPTSTNTGVESTGSTGALIFRQHEIIVPIVFLSATQTITVTYGKADKKVAAPGVPEDSVFTFKTRSTPTGTFVAIPDPSAADQDPRNYEVKVAQAADGSGKVTLPEAQRTVKAGSTGNTFEITYTAVGKMDGGKIRLTVPTGDGDTWTPLSNNNLTVQSSGTLTADGFSNGDRTVTYTISALGKGDTVRFTYTGVEVQSTVSGDSDRDGTAGPDPKTVPLLVEVSGHKDGSLQTVTTTEANITVDAAADGSGLASIAFTNPSGEFSPIENDDVPANLDVDIAITYTAIGDMSGAPEAGINEFKANAGLVSLELTIPVAFPLPKRTDDSNAAGYTTESDPSGEIEVSSTGSTPTFELFGRIVRVKNVLLARGHSITINYANVTTPAERGNHTFAIRSQGRRAKDGDRRLVALTAGSPQVTIGPVISGSGSAKITTPAANDAGEYKLIAGKPGATIVIEFTAPGPLAGGEAKLRVPSGWVAPGNSGKGYTTVVPSAGVRIGTLRFDATDLSVIIPIIDMGKDDKLTITYGAGGGASGADVPQTVGDHQFTVSTITRGGTESAETFKSIADITKLVIETTPLEGSGVFTVTPDDVPVTTAAVSRTAQLVFTYKAAGNINSIGISVAANWPNFQHPSSAQSNGRVSVSRGNLAGVTADNDVGSSSISVENLNLTEGQQVRITYSVTTPTVVGEGEFTVRSGSSNTGGGSALANPVRVYVVSVDGSGKVSAAAGDVAAVTTTAPNAVINDAWRAGEKGTLTFYYNLASTPPAAREYVRNGELRIAFPSTWSAPPIGKVTVTQLASAGGAQVPEADRPTRDVQGRIIIVSIKKQQPGEVIEIKVADEALAPTRREVSRFRVSSRSSSSGSGGQLLQITKNRIDNARPSEVIVTVVDGKNGSGSATVTHNGGSLANVNSGSNNNELRFVYTASAELSTRLSDGSVADRTDPGFTSANINTMAGIQLQIPTGWASPNINDSEGNPSGANVTVTGPRTAFFDFNPATRGFDGDLVISGHTISVPIRRLLPGQSITLTYGAGTDKAEAQGATGDATGAGAFNILSKGGESGDTFGKLPKGGQLAEAGEFRFKVINAGDGSGTAALRVTAEAESVGKVHGGNSGIEIEFTYTATGKIAGGELRIEPPTGWTVPQPSPGGAGFTQRASDSISSSSLGLPTFDGVGVTFPIPTLDAGQSVIVEYGSGGGPSGAVAPKTRAIGDNASKFAVFMRGSTSGSFGKVTDLPVEVVNAKNGTGTARVAPGTTTAGHTDTYTVTYTAKGPLFAGAVRLTIPDGWNLKAYNKDESPVGTSGKLAGAVYPAATATGDAARQITANITELQGGQTVTFTLKGTKAQVTKLDSAIFNVESARTQNSSDFVLLSGDDVAKVKVNQAANGSGTMTSSPSIVRVGQTLENIRFTFTPVGQMDAEGRIELDIPDGWTAPNKDAGAAGGIAIEGPGAGKVNRPDPSGRTAIAKINAGAILTPADVFTIVYNKPTAPAAAGADSFTARSLSQTDGTPVALSASPEIFVSPQGDGAGKMVIDKTEVAAATAGFAIKFTYTAAQDMAGGELTVKIPPSWTTAKDKITGLTGTTGGSSLRDGDRTVAISVPSLTEGSNIVFTYTGTAQNVAGTAIFETRTRLFNTGTLTSIAEAPTLAVKNVAKGTGTVTFNTGDPVDPSRVAAASSGNQITFDFKAVGTMDGGAVSMDVPGDWSSPQRVSGVAGYVTASTPSGGSVGEVAVNGQNVTVPIITLGPGQIVRIVYGSGSGSSGAVAQANAGGATFVFRSNGRSASDFADATIGNHPTINVTNARDGSGTMTVKRIGAEAGKETTATAGSVAEFEFTYTPDGTINGGRIQLTTPAGWTAPNGASGTRGYTIAETDPGAALGTLTFGTNSVTIPISALSVGQTIRIKYGSGGGINGVRVPAETGEARFGVKSQGLTDAQGGQLIELLTASPVIMITAPGDGFGRATVSGGPFTGGSSGNTVTIIFTANANVIGGSVSVDVPMGWTAPTANNITAVSTGSIGDLTYRDQTVTIDDVTLNSGQTITLTYSNVTVQGAMGSGTFIVKSKGEPEGTLTELAGVSSTKSEWSVTIINAANGSGKLMAIPAFVVAGSVVDLNLVYTASGTITGGVVRVTIPANWTTPQNVNVNDAGYVAVEASAGNVISTAVVSANMVTVPITSLAPDGTVTISYKKATAPAAEVSEFMGQSRGSGAGTSQALAAPATVTVTSAADSIVISSEAQTLFKDQISAPITIEIQEGGKAAASGSDVAVALTSSSTTGMFDTSATGDFDGTVTSATIPAGETWVNVYYRDTVAGSATLTAMATLAGAAQTATQGVTVLAGATALAIETSDTLFAGDSIDIAVTLWGADGNASGFGTDLEVMLATSATDTGVFKLMGNPITSVTIPAGEMASQTITYEDTMVGMATLTATTVGLTDGTLEVMVHNIIAEVMVDPMLAKADDVVTVTATAKPGLMPPPSFTVGDIVQAGINMDESPAGTYTGMFTVVADVHADGMYDVVVTVGEGDAAVMETVENGVTIDNTAPMITAGELSSSVQNGEMAMLTVTSEESGLTVMGTGVMALDTMAESDEITFMESGDTPGTYIASHMISMDNEAKNGMYMISVTAMDAVGNMSAVVSISVHLQNGSEFELTIPANLSLIHIPLKVTSVNGENQSLNNISDLYDALGADNVDLLITYDVQAGRWASFLNAADKGSPADRAITADLGILAAMNNEVTLMLIGEAWGEDGVSMINLSQGTNLVGVPLDSGELNMVSDLLSDDVSIVITSDQGEFKSITQAGDAGDGPIVGGRSYIITATQATTIEVTGEAWSMPSAGVSAAPIAIPHIAAVDGITPVLAIRGSVTGESRGVAQADLRITIKNLSTGATVSVGSDLEGNAGQYDVTFVDTKAARAAQVGDVLEIKAESSNPLVGVQPLRHIVTVDDVKNSRIQLAELVTYEIPAKTELLLNYPNPFNPETWIPFRLAEDSQVSLTIYDRAGRVVRSIELGHRPAAVYQTRAKAIYWDGRNDFGERVASGMYFYTLTTKDFSATRRMVIVK